MRDNESSQGMRSISLYLLLYTLCVWADEPVPGIQSSVTVIGRVTAEVPGQVDVLDADRLGQIPGVSMDDRLRSVPGFSLLRRSSSVVAHPTTQGVSLRGIGSNGASRTLVLWDGVPLNDPFGGWVYWSRIPVDDVSRVEVSTASPTSAFGDRAMGGVIAVFSREPAPGGAEFRFEGGAAGTTDGALRYSAVHSRWGLTVGGRGLHAGGYFVVPDALRGAIDRRAGEDFTTGYTRSDLFGPVRRLSIKVDALGEERRNGTALQTNSTVLGTASVHYESPSLSVLLWHTRESFSAVFSSVAASRSAERLTFTQVSPADGAGASAVWQFRSARASWTLGADSVRSSGYSADRFEAGQRRAGGSIWTRGAFAHAVVARGPAQFSAGLRADSAGRGAGFLSPSGAIAVTHGPVRGWVSAWRGFRSPTLNELYRQFQAGNALTLANNGLRAERMTSVETGASLRLERTYIAVSLYRNALDDFVTNVTLSSSPTSIVRQRRNAGAGVARGVEADVRRAFGPVTTHAGYLLADSRFSNGLRLPQVPRHQGSADVTWQHGAFSTSAGLRAWSSQFDDDRNSFVLPGYSTLFVAIARRFTHGVSVYSSVENVLNREYLVALAMYPNTGSPRLWRIGARWQTPQSGAARP